MENKDEKAGPGPGPTFYVATGLERGAEAANLIKDLERLGLRNTYNWTVHGSLQAQPERWKEVSQLEHQGVLDADIYIGLLPGGRGTHFEMGTAVTAAVLRQRRLVLLVGEQGDARTCIFYHHPAVLRAASVNDALQIIRGWRAAVGR